MDEPVKFVVGDKVTFEWAKNGTAPRWNLGNDQGASGVYGTGRVIDLSDKKSFLIQYQFERRTLEYNFNYSDQGKPGFPVLDKPTEEELKSVNALKRWMDDATGIR
jgi:hypothetical protein